MYGPSPASALRRALGDDRALDVLIALAAFALMIIDVPGLAAADNSLTGATVPPVLAAGSATLLLRRKWPWIPYLAALVFLGWLHQLTLIQFALYSLGRFRGRRTAVVATVLYVAVACALYYVLDWGHRAETLSSFLSLVVPVGVLSSAVGVATYRQDLVREVQALQAVQAERASVARDVHDMVGRELTMLAVTAEVRARRALGGPHEQDFDSLAETARRAHHMLNEIIVARADERTATPGLDGLASLAAETRRAGTPVTLSVSDRAYGLSPLRQAAVYRVVQECLTNAVKHARGEGVSVTIGVRGGELHVHVRNRLPSTVPPTAPVSSGTGTFSMRERVESMGGALTTRRTSTTYEVEATLPSGTA
ncbi:ATP-binding protein [Streptomyces sp. BPTC-684]|uniref:sensor histidine kinase n=1 Tax=Streptomyces sp. BPTC-684 TaxID=3043734 RepID=UPI0024B284F3|nr:ATP-binding protein [Streptomyces sp. BPTC-684]WHM38744.1 histidine kinase [Streptomyces sp. BPTC-684]